MDDAKRAVDAAGWDWPWGADADHLKTVDDLPSFVDNAADVDSVDVLKQKIVGRNWNELSAL